jgi:hypothetical protein
MPIFNRDTLEDGSFKGIDRGATVSIILDRSEPGHGPRLHRHPYDETWIVQDGLYPREPDDGHRVARVNGPLPPHLLWRRSAGTAPPGDLRRDHARHAAAGLALHEGSCEGVVIVSVREALSAR